MKIGILEQMGIDWTLVIGTIGLLLVLTAFVVNLLKRLTQDSVAYNILNIIGPGLLAYYAITLNSIPFLILEIVWASFAVYKLINILRRQ